MVLNASQLRADGYTDRAVNEHRVAEQRRRCSAGHGGHVQRAVALVQKTWVSSTATQGGNKGRAKVCQHGGWTAPGSNAGASFSNQGDCVNDGAKGLAAQPVPLDPQTGVPEHPGTPQLQPQR